jgi:pyrroline-5-carboxylate reductase
MQKKLGFIGAGNMAAAIIGGTAKAKIVSGSDIIISDTDRNRVGLIAEKYNIQTAASNKALAKQADILFLSVKPQVYSTVISEIREHVKQDALVIILAAGLGIKAVAEMFKRSDLKFVKTMPNTPALVNCAITAVCAAENVSPQDMENVLEIFNSIGKTEILPESQFDIFTALAGSSPAYVYMFVEAMAAAGVKHGLSRKQAIEISAYAVLGTAKMLIETDEHPAVLRDAVCSPGGTTIEAVCELEKQGFRQAVISAVNVCTEKYNRMGQKD